MFVLHWMDGRSVGWLNAWSLSLSSCSRSNIVILDAAFSFCFILKGYDTSMHERTTANLSQKSHKSLSKLKFVAFICPSLRFSL